MDALTPKEQAARDAIDQWFGDMVQTLGPVLTTEQYNQFTAQREPLKGRVGAAVANAPAEAQAE